MSSFFDKILGAATGGLASEVKDLVTTYWPPDVSPEKKAQFELEMDKLEFEREKAVDAATQAAEDSLNKRLEMYEGTAKDLLAIPVFGALMLFIRGSQRTVWGMAAIYFDYLWFVTSLKMTDQQQTALIIINCLVLSFLFGERALKNLMPLIIQLLGVKASSLKDGK